MSTRPSRVSTAAAANLATSVAPGAPAPLAARVPSCRTQRSDLRVVELLERSRCWPASLDCTQRRKINREHAQGAGGRAPPHVEQILAVIDAVCEQRLDSEYAELCRRVIGRLARKRPSPIVRGDLASGQRESCTPSVRSTSFSTPRKAPTLQPTSSAPGSRSRRRRWRTRPQWFVTY